MTPFERAQLWLQSYRAAVEVAAVWCANPPRGCNVNPPSEDHLLGRADRLFQLALDAARPTDSDPDPGAPS